MRFFRPGVVTQESVIENLPFEYAIPMLTGWELVLGCDDEHVKEIGIWGPATCGWAACRSHRSQPHETKSVPFCILTGLS